MNRLRRLSVGTSLWEEAAHGLAFSCRERAARDGFKKHDLARSGQPEQRVGLQRADVLFDTLYINMLIV